MVFLCLALALGAAGCSLRLEKAEPVSRETERLPAPLPQPEPQPEPEPEPEPTQLDRVEAQATYTAMMTDTLLEV